VRACLSVTGSSATSVSSKVCSWSLAGFDLRGGGVRNTVPSVRTAPSFSDGLSPLMKLPSLLPRMLGSLLLAALAAFTRRRRHAAVGAAFRDRRAQSHALLRRDGHVFAGRIRPGGAHVAEREDGRGSGKCRLIVVEVEGKPGAYADDRNVTLNATAGAHPCSPKRCRSGGRATMASSRSASGSTTRAAPRRAHRADRRSADRGGVEQDYHLPVWRLSRRR
jgi:hypothetical protein